MLSSTFSTELEPEPRLRWLVLGSASTMLLVGLLIVYRLSVGPGIRFVVAGAWASIGLLELRRLVLGYRSCRRVRIYADGSAETADATGTWHSARFQPGSVVLDRFAWLRIDAGRGRRFAELLVGNSRKNNEWRRLQVIWRHLGAAI